MEPLFNDAHLIIIMIDYYLIKLEDIFNFVLVNRNCWDSFKREGCCTIECFENAKLMEKFRIKHLDINYDQFCDLRLKPCYKLNDPIIEKLIDYFKKMKLPIVKKENMKETIFNQYIFKCNVIFDVGLTFKMNQCYDPIFDQHTIVMSCTWFEFTKMCGFETTKFNSRHFDRMYSWTENYLKSHFKTKSEFNYFGTTIVLECEPSETLNLTNGFKKQDGLMHVTENEADYLSSDESLDEDELEKLGNLF
jgi:hypothetical protein